jgi:hypothetical protein
VGPFGTICIGGQPNWPPGAVVKVSILHGGGGPHSHMDCEIDGVLMESGGNGDIVEPPTAATPIDDSSWTDFWYLPGPIIENTLPGPVTKPPVVTPTVHPDYLRLIYEQLAGPVGPDGYGHGWSQLGSGAGGANLTVVDFLAKYKPALDALLAEAGAANTVELRTTIPPAKKAAAPKATAPAKKAAPGKATPPAKKAAPGKATLSKV